MKKKISKKIPYSGTLVAKLFRTLAPRIGARVIVEPKWGIVGQINYKNGHKRYFRYSSLDLNTLGASEISKDKDYANFFMKKMKYKTVQGEAFFSTSWAKTIHSKRDINAAYTYATTLGFPVIIKPNSGSQGSGVMLVHTRQEFYAGMRRIFATQDRVALVQRLVCGKDYRVVVLDGRIISAYERIPLSVVGDGRSSIQILLSKKQRKFVASSRDTQIRTKDPRITIKLARQNLRLSSVLARGQRVYLLDNANLSTGGDAVDVTKAIHPQFKKLAINLTRDMGLRMCGVDLMVDGDINKKPGKYWILEINAAPGLDHYVQTGREQKKIVESMYLEVLKSMGR